MMIFLLQSCSLYVKQDQGCLLQVTGSVWSTLIYSLCVLPVGSPIGSLFTTASIPFTCKKYHSRFFHFKQWKRTEAPGKDNDWAPNPKRHKSNSVDDHKLTTSVQPNPLEMSELYVTACESPEDNDAVHQLPIILFHNRQSKRGKKRSNDYVQMVSKRRLKLSFNELLKTSRERKHTKKGKGYILHSLVISPFMINVFIGWRSDGEVK